MLRKIGVNVGKLGLVLFLGASLVAMWWFGFSRLLDQTWPGR